MPRMQCYRLRVDDLGKKRKARRYQPDQKAKRAERNGCCVQKSIRRDGMNTFTMGAAGTTSRNLCPYVRRGAANRYRPPSDTGRAMYCRGYYVAQDGTIRVVYTSTDGVERAERNGTRLDTYNGRG